MIKFIKTQKKLEGKTVLLRTDLDAPSRDGKILDDFRIRMSLPTIEFLHGRGAKIIIVSKEGQPQGWDESMSLRPAAERIAELMRKKMVVHSNHFPNYDAHHIIFYPHDIREPGRLEALKDSPSKDIIILENIRFYKEEQANDPKFAKMLASIADIFVNDAFAVSHRAEASVSSVPKYLPSFAGLNFEKELKGLTKALTLEKHPFILLMGGAKISDKIATLRFLGKKADKFLIGGALGNLFFVAKGYDIGKSRCELDKLNLAKDLLRNFKDKIVLPVDFVVAKESDHKQGIRVCAPDSIKKDEAMLDIGPKTILEFSKYIKSAGKMIWNGPMGVFEEKPFSHGTMSLAWLFASKSKGKAYGVVGGGDTLEAIDKAKVADQIDFISTAGGAMLNFLAGEELPGVRALKSSVAK